MFRNVRSSLWLVLVAFLFVGCGQDSCPTAPKPGVLDFEFQDMVMSHNFMGHTAVFMSDGSEVRVTRYSQEFSNSMDVLPRLGGHTFGVIISDLQGRTLAESYGVYCGGFTITENVATVELRREVFSFGEALDRMSRLKSYVLNHTLDFEIPADGQPKTFGTYSTLLSHSIPVDGLVGCALRSGNIDNPATGCQ